MSGTAAPTSYQSLPGWIQSSGGAVAPARLTAADNILFAINAATASPSNRRDSPLPARGTRIAPCPRADPCGSPVAFQAVRVLQDGRRGRYTKLFRSQGPEAMNEAAPVKR